MGPDMVQLASTIDADNAIWRAQERVKDGEFPVYAKEDPSVFRTVDELFPQVRGTEELPCFVHRCLRRNRPVCTAAAVVTLVRRDHLACAGDDRTQDLGQVQFHAGRWHPVVLHVDQP